MTTSRLLLLTACCLLFCSLPLRAQRCLLYTQQGDTIVGKVKFNMLRSSILGEAQGGTIDRMALQQGLTVTQKDKPERFYRPSELKEAFLFPNNFDTLHLISFKKTFFLPAIARSTVFVTDTNSHVLVESSRTKGPLLWCRYYLETVEKTEYGYNNSFRFYDEQTFTDVFRLGDQWTELPEDRSSKKSTLITYLAACPKLVEKLKHNKISLVSGMNKLVTLYNTCHIH